MNEKEKLFLREKETVFTKLITTLVRDNLVKEEISGYVTTNFDVLLATNEDVDIYLTKQREGAKFNIYTLKVNNKTDKPLQIEERNFIDLIDRSIFAISIFYDNELYEMPPFSHSTVTIIAKGDM